mgnify:CR=1 FL=1
MDRAGARGIGGEWERGDQALIFFDGFGIAVVGIGVGRVRSRLGCRVEDLVVHMKLVCIVR